MKDNMIEEIRKLLDTKNTPELRKVNKIAITIEIPHLFTIEDFSIRRRFRLQESQMRMEYLLEHLLQSPLLQSIQVFTAGWSI